MTKPIYPFEVFMPESTFRPLKKTLKSGFIGHGDKVDKFELLFSEKFSIPNVATVNSGTSALRLALSSAGVGPVDEVISTPYTFVATNTSILEQSKPIFADIEVDTVNINADDIEHRITEKTKAIMCVHWGRLSL